MSAPAAEQLHRRCRRALAEHRRRARADRQQLNYGLAELVALAAAPCCAYCRMPVALDFHIDHARPTGRGGAHALGNLAVACARCNGLKGVLDAAEFAELLGLLARLHPAAATDLTRRLLAGGRRYRTGRHAP